jgi:hypothetical protein
MKNEGISNISYDKKKRIRESVKKRTYPKIKITEQ